MPKLYSPATEVEPMLDEVIDQYHGELREAHTRVGMWFVVSDGKGPAVSKNGWPCDATIRPENGEARAKGTPDATILIDKYAWEKKSEDEQRALLSHELTHLELKRSRKTGMIRTDDNSRPLFKTRPHDYEYGGFSVVAKRFGDAAPEVINLRTLHATYGQLLFPWGDEKTTKPKLHRSAETPKTARA